MVLCLFETVFILEQITENRSGVFLEISEKLFLAGRFCILSLKQFGKFHNHSV